MKAGDEGKDPLKTIQTDLAFHPGLLQVGSQSVASIASAKASSPSPKPIISQPQVKVSQAILNLRESANLRESLMSGLSRGTRINYQLSDSDEDAKDNQAQQQKNDLRKSKQTQ